MRSLFKLLKYSGRMLKESLLEKHNLTSCSGVRLQRIWFAFAFANCLVIRMLNKPAVIAATPDLKQIWQCAHDEDICGSKLSYCHYIKTFITVHWKVCVKRWKYIFLSVYEQLDPCIPRCHAVFKKKSILQLKLEKICFYYFANLTERWGWQFGAGW